MSEGNTAPTSSWIPAASPPPAVGGTSGTSNFGATSMNDAGYIVQSDQGAQGNQGHYKGVHPIAAFFHIFFKAAALILFILGSIFSTPVFLFIIIVLLLAVDFWTTKNVSGRLLVSLRWWTEVSEDGATHWVFESCPDAESKVNPYDRWFFWLVLGVNFVVWVVFSIINIMSLGRLSIALVGALLGGVNVLGYTKCRRDKSKLGELILRQAAERPELLRGAADTMFKG